VYAFNCFLYKVYVSVYVAVRVNDSQLVMLSEKAHYDHLLSGYLYKRTADSTKWQQRWFVLYQVSEFCVDELSLIYMYIYIHLYRAGRDLIYDDPICESLTSESEFKCESTFSLF